MSKFNMKNIKTQKSTLIFLLLACTFFLADVLYRYFNKAYLATRIVAQQHMTHGQTSPIVISPFVMNIALTLFIVALPLDLILIWRLSCERNIPDFIADFIDIFKIIIASLVLLTFVSSLTHSPSVYQSLFEKVTIPLDHLLVPVVLDWSTSLIGFILSAGKLLMLVTAINIIPPTFKMLR